MVLLFFIIIIYLNNIFLYLLGADEILYLCGFQLFFR